MYPSALPRGHDRDLVHAVDARQQLGAQRVAGLVPGDHPALVLVERAARLHPGDDPLDRVVEVALEELCAARPCGEDRGLVADVGQVGARQAGRLAGERGEVHVGAQRLVSRVHLEDRLATGDVGRRDQDLAIEAARPQQRRVQLVQQVRRGDHHEVAGGAEAVHLDEQLVERLLALGVVVGAAARADGVELVDEDDRRAVLARLGEQPPDAGSAQAGEHLDERRGRLGEELRAGLVARRPSPAASCRCPEGRAA